jgi:tetratricopeptide (TPR) repeat protein
MLLLLFLQAPASPPPTAPQVYSQSVNLALPPAMDALITAKNWAGLADWFETVSPATRGAYYEWWIQGLNRSQRWERLVVVCEALQPQLEAKSGPRLGTYRLYRAQALSRLGRHAEAAQAHAENGRLGLSEGFSNACTEARLAQDWTGLLTYSDELLQKQPQNALGLAWKGEALARMDRLAEAEPVLRNALERDSAIAYAWNNLGRCLNEKKAWTEACEALNKALALEPNQLEALFNRGRALFELKRYKECRDDFRAALILKPGDPVLQANLQQAERYATLPPPKSAKRR